MANSAVVAAKFPTPREIGVTLTNLMLVKNKMPQVVDMHNSEIKKYIADESNFFLNEATNTPLESTVIMP